MNGQSDITIWARLLHVLLLRPFVKLFSGINVTGKENLDHLDQYIIIANHNSHLDIVLLYFLLPISHIVRTHPVADKPHFSRSRLVFRLVDFLFKPIWVTRGKPDLTDDPFGEIKRIIDAGQNVIIFPEGTRGVPGEMQHFKSGIGRLMAQYPEVPILPVFLVGPERALPRASALLLPIWNNIIIGPPQLCVGGHREITHRLEEVLLELSRSESARRHKRSPHEGRTAKHIAFLGIDGSGKSTTSRMVAEAISDSSRVCLVSDELKFFEQGQAREMQPLITEKLRQVISGYAKKAKSLKLYKIPKLMELLLRNQLLKEAQRWYSPDLIVLDGSPLLNLLAWSVLYKKDTMDRNACTTALAVLSGRGQNIGHDDPIFKRFPELAHLKRLGLTRLALPDIVILIDLPSDVACQRIETRGEQKQVHETSEKLDRLRRAYLLVCEVVEKDWHVSTAILNGEQTRESLCRSGIEFVRKSISTGTM